MYCPKCGAKKEGNVQVCPACNSVIDGTDVPVTPVGVKTNRLAVVSFLCGILSLFTCFLTAIPAVILGVLSLVKINKSKGGQKGTGIAIAGIALPVVLIPVFSILLAILMPALARVRDVAQRQVCVSNMKVIANAMKTYAQENDGSYPTGSKWCDLLAETGEISNNLSCPGDGGYALNANALRLGKKAPSDMVLLYEAVSSEWNQVGGPELLSTENHEFNGCNVLFVDGYIQFVKTEDLNRLRWTVDEFEITEYDYK